MCVRWFTTDRSTRWNVKGGIVAKTNFSVFIDGKSHSANLAENDAMREAKELGPRRKNGCVTVKQNKRIIAIWFKGQRITLQQANVLRNAGEITL